MTISAPSEVIDTLVLKGFVAVHGISLTVNAVDDDSFGVALIPTTLDLTTLGSAEVGTKLNLEGDPIGRHVNRWMRARVGAPGEFARRRMRATG